MQEYLFGLREKCAGAQAGVETTSVSISSTSASQTLTSHFVIQSMPVKLRAGRSANRDARFGIGMLLQIVKVRPVIALTEACADCSNCSDPSMRSAKEQPWAYHELLMQSDDFWCNSREVMD